MSDLTAVKLQGPVPRRVLVVDDDAALRILIATSLSSHVSVDTASDGADALRCCASVEYAVILLDLMMPGMDGMTFLREFKAQYPANRTIIIAITAAANTLGLKPDAVHAIVRKPFDLQKLRAIVFAAVTLLSEGFGGTRPIRLTDTA